MTDTQTTHKTRRPDPGSYWFQTDAGPVEVWFLSGVEVRVTAGRDNNSDETSDPIVINRVPYDLFLTLTRTDAIEEETHIREEGNRSGGGSNPLGHTDRVWTSSRGWSRQFGPSRALTRSGTYLEDATQSAQKYLNEVLLDQITETLEEMGPELETADQISRASFAIEVRDKGQELRDLALKLENLADSVHTGGLPLSGGWILRNELTDRTGPRDYVVSRVQTVLEEMTR